MNSDSLLNIINIIIKNEEKFGGSPNEIYGLFKKHGYEGNIETLKLDLKNLLNDVIKSDEELSKVAGGKVSKLAAGAVAALTCFPMNSFASGTADTKQNEHSAVNKITDTIKSGAKKVGDATKEYVIEPAKDAAKTVARNPGKSAAVASVLVAYGLLSGLAGKKLASVPKVETQGMTEEEKQTVEQTSNLLKKLTEKKCVVIDDTDKDNKEYSWDLSAIESKPKELNGDKIKIGELAGKLMPQNPPSGKPTPAYADARDAFIAFEKAMLNALEEQKQTIEQATEKIVKELEEKAQALDAAKKDAETFKTKQDEYEQKLQEQEKQTSELNTELTRLRHEIGANTKANILLPSYPNLGKIYNTINTALGNTNTLKSLKDQVSTGNLQVYRQFRGISKMLRGEDTRSPLIISEKKLNGQLNLAELLLLGGLTNGIVNGQISIDEQDFDGFNLKKDTKWTDIKKLNNEARIPNSWETWLAPKTEGFAGSKKKGLKNATVVKQLPELILAAAALQSSDTLTSLLRALEVYLAADVNSDYRENVNMVLQKVGMSFDANENRLVSTTKK